MKPKAKQRLPARYLLQFIPPNKKARSSQLLRAFFIPYLTPTPPPQSLSPSPSGPFPTPASGQKPCRWSRPARKPCPPETAANRSPAGRRSRYRGWRRNAVCSGRKPLLARHRRSSPACPTGWQSGHKLWKGTRRLTTTVCHPERIRTSISWSVFRDPAVERPGKYCCADGNRTHSSGLWDRRVTVTATAQFL